MLVLVYHSHYQIGQIATRLQNLKKESNGYNVKSTLSFNLLIINPFRAHLKKKKYLIKKSVRMFYLNQVLSGKHQVGIMFRLVVSVFLLGGMQCISIRYWARFFVLQCWALCIGVGTVT